MNAGDKLDLPIKGISCASCVAKIEKGLSELTGVIDAKVNFATERAAITLDTNQVHVGDIIRTIQDLGYEAGSEKVTLPVQGMSCASCVEKVRQPYVVYRGSSEPMSTSPLRRPPWSIFQGR